MIANRIVPAGVCAAAVAATSSAPATALKLAPIVPMTILMRGSKLRMGPTRYIGRTFRPEFWPPFDVYAESSALATSAMSAARQNTPPERGGLAVVPAGRGRGRNDDC